jgi:hypothetical protein
LTTLTNHDTPARRALPALPATACVDRAIGLLRDAEAGLPAGVPRVRLAVLIQETEDLLTSLRLVESHRTRPDPTALERP